MSKLRVHAFSVSLDGFGAGVEQSLANPLGRGGESLHEWIVPTRTFRAMSGNKPGGVTGTDDDFAARSFDGLGGRDPRHTDAEALTSGRKRAVELDPKGDPRWPPK